MCSRFWLGEFFNRMERYGRYLTDEQKHGLEEACDTWSRSPALAICLDLKKLSLLLNDHCCT